MERTLSVETRNMRGKETEDEKTGLRLWFIKKLS